jgi:phosphoglycolate phosphatase-like HAD superfamily hydrolase
VIGVVSNQDGMPLGHITDGDFRHKIERLQYLLGEPLDARVCYAHPDGVAEEFHSYEALRRRRLPSGAMLIELMLAHPAEMRRGTLFVGATADDAATALYAGVDFMTVRAIFGE